MQQFTDVHFWTSHQHKDMTKARQERDVWDTEKLFFLSSLPPFSLASTLHCIDTGVCTEEVDADAAVPIGKKILASMEGKNVLEYVFRKHNQVITMDKKSQVQVEKNSVEIDPQLLFQRLNSRPQMRWAAWSVHTWTLQLPPCFIPYQWRPPGSW